MQHDATGAWATTVKSRMLPQTKAQLHLPQGRYTGRINEKIQHELWRDRAEQYIDRKLNLQETRGVVDWAALGGHPRLLSGQRRATRLKLVFRWAPTNARMVITRQSESPLCPLCNSTQETIEHMLRCPSPSATAARKNAMTELEKSLDDIGTHPDLTTLICLAVDLGDDPWCDTADSDIDLKDVMEAQGDI